MDMKLPIDSGGKTPSRTMSVGELVKLLKKFDPKLGVTYGNGWVVGVKTTKGRSQIVCTCFPNCGKGCATEKLKLEKQVLLDLMC